MISPYFLYVFISLLLFVAITSNTYFFFSTPYYILAVKNHTSAQDKVSIEYSCIYSDGTFRHTESNRNVCVFTDYN